MAWIRRLTNVFRRRHVRSEIDEELRYHIEARIERNLSAGMSPQEARADALKRFGGSLLALDYTQDADALAWLDTILQDVRYGLRSIRSKPFVTLVTILSLALAIGASTAIYTVVDRVLLRTLPYQEPDRVAVLWTASRLNGSRYNVTVPNFDDWKSQNHTFQDLAMYREADASFSVNGESGWVDYAFVYGDFFHLLGRPPMIGSVFSAASSDPHEVVLSYGLWRSQFDGRRDVIGRTVNLSGTDYRVIGVMPEDFAFPSEDTRLWTPAAALPNWPSRRQDRQTGFGTVLGRLAPGVQLEQAGAELQGITARLLAEYPKVESNGGSVNIVPLAAQVHGKTVPFMLAMLSSAVLLVLLIACANAAHLQLARGAARGREFSIRTALGASKGRIFRQLITESILLSCLAGAAGVAIAAWGVRGLVALGPHGIARLERAHVDGRVLGFSLVLSLATGLLFGFAPAIRISRDAANRQQTAGTESRSMRRAFVTAQVALAIVLLSGAGLLIRSLEAVLAINPGFQTSRVLAATLRFPNALPRAQRAALYQETMSKLGASPGVRAAGAISTMFYRGDDGKFGLRAVEGRSPEPQQHWTAMTWSTVSGDYFQALGVSLVRGRFFTDRDTRGATPVVIINETMARRYWPGGDPIGKGIKGFDPRGQNDEWVRVIGIVKDMHSRGLDRSPIAQIYETQAQSLDETENLVVQTDASAEFLRSVVRSVDKSAALIDVTTLDAQLREQNAPRRFQTILLSTFAALALALAAAGIFAMMHYSVAQRTQEIGIRMALGARHSQVLRMIFREGFLLIASGIVIGIGGSLGLTRSIRTLLFEVGPGDPFTLTVVSLLLIGAGLLACYVPARRATRVDPMCALRCD